MRHFHRAAALALLAGCASGGQSGTTSGDGSARAAGSGASGAATGAAIGAADLRTRLYLYADDSMQGRETGTIGHVKSTEYIARELRRIGLEPAGDGGTYFQNVPMVRRALDPASVIIAGSTTLRAGVDFVASTFGGADARPIEGAQLVFGGAVGDSAGALSAEQQRGRIVVRLQNPAAVTMSFGGRGRGGAGGAAGEAVASITVVPSDTLPTTVVRTALHPREGAVSMRPEQAPPPSAAIVTMTRRAAERLFGQPLASLSPGTTGPAVRGAIRFTETVAPARNVVAILRGGDAALRGQYVAIGAHNDHVGFSTGPAVDHDSLHLYNVARYTGRIARAGQQATAEQQATLAVLRASLDSIRRLRPVRLDSIRNGADDDGSGTVAALEIAEAFALGGVKPRRSLLFVWHTGEEKGLLGARWYTEHPTVPRDSIVAQLNMDMVGRGGAEDIAGGGPRYLQLVGSRRLSTELGTLVETVNARQPEPLTLDYGMDANGHPERIYCRSDHYEYARWGIPITFFTTGLHGDYHQVTDEPQYIDYPHLERVTRLVFDVAADVAANPVRPRVDQPRPDPRGTCRQ